MLKLLSCVHLKGQVQAYGKHSVRPCTSCAKGNAAPKAIAESRLKVNSAEPAGFKAATKPKGVQYMSSQLMRDFRTPAGQRH